MRILHALLLALLATPALAVGDVAVRGGMVHTMAGEPIRDGVVVVRDGKVAAVGPAATTPIPDGMRTLRAAVVTPGLIDAHSVVGLTGYLNQPQDQDQVDASAASQPELRAIDSYNARERLIEWVRGFGVTTVHAGHAPGKLISGETLVAKTRGETVDEAVIVPRAMVAATLGESAVEKDDKKTPGTRSKLVATLRAEFVKAQGYARKMASEGKDGEKPDRDLHLEALVRVLNREVPLLVTAHRHQDIVSALRVAQEFDLRLVLDGAAEAHVLQDEIRTAGVPVIVHPTMTRASDEAENLTMENAAILSRAGIPVALQSGYEGYVPKTRVVLFEAGVAAAHGLGFDGALRAITVDAARILGLDSRLGSLEPGKDGDLALYDGDPFEYTTHCIGTIIEGEVVSDAVR
jgi:imidazolonepropionase-like amidohydrolase